MESSVIVRSVPPDSENPPEIVELCDESQRQARSLSPAPQPSFGQELRIFLSTFVTIFLAELGDKTQLTTLLISAESNAPWVVFLGAGSALVATSLLGVWVGCWLSKRVSARTLETAAAALLLLISVLLLWDVVQG